MADSKLAGCKKVEDESHVYLADRMDKWGKWADALYALGFLAAAVIAFALAWNEGIRGALTKALEPTK